VSEKFVFFLPGWKVSFTQHFVRSGIKWIFEFKRYNGAVFQVVCRFRYSVQHALQSTTVCSMLCSQIHFTAFSAVNCSVQHALQSTSVQHALKSITVCSMFCSQLQCTACSAVTYSVQHALQSTTVYSMLCSQPQRTACPLLVTLFILQIWLLHRIINCRFLVALLSLSRDVATQPLHLSEFISQNGGKFSHSNDV
jgi:hypothetical protein